MHPLPCPAQRGMAVVSISIGREWNSRPAYPSSIFFTITNRGYASCVHCIPCTPCIYACRVSVNRYNFLLESLSDLDTRSVE